jgi:hypothetical protein
MNSTWSRPALIRRRTIHARDCDVIELHVDAQLRPVVKQVIDEATDDNCARRRFRDMVSKLEGPILLHVLVRRVDNTRTAFFNPLIEDLE